MTAEQAKKLGGKIHRILNHTPHRKLTLKEYSRLVGHIGELFNEAQRLSAIS